jgi:hypothetical protein
MEKVQKPSNSKWIYVCQKFSEPLDTCNIRRFQWTTHPLKDRRAASTNLHSKGCLWTLHERCSPSSFSIKVYKVSSEVLTSLNMKGAVFWVVCPHVSVGFLLDWLIYFEEKAIYSSETSKSLQTRQRYNPADRTFRIMLMPVVWSEDAYAYAVLQEVLDWGKWRLFPRNRGKKDS